MKKVLSKKKILDLFFNPKNVAVVGASNDLKKIGGFIFSQIKKVKDVKAYPINSTKKKVQKILSFKDLSEIKKKVDLVVVSIPAKFVCSCVEQGAKIGIKNFCIISAGFKEIGSVGKAREDELLNLKKIYKLNIVGPNCLGILNPKNNLNLSFAKDLPKFGKFSVVSQSGALVNAIIDKSFNFDCGFSKLISLGNKSDIDELDILEYLYYDKDTEVIIFYIEYLNRAKEFEVLLEKVSKKKPVIILKAGNSKSSQSAISSHTGSLAQEGFLIEALLDGKSILVGSLDEIFNLIIASKQNKIPKNENLVVLTNAGGLGVISSDIILNTNLNLLEINDLEKKHFKDLPCECSLKNPIDILGDATSKRYKLVLLALEKISKVQNVLVILTPQMTTDCLEIARCLVEHNKKSKKVIFSSFVGGFQVKKAVQFLRKNSFPNFSTPKDAITSFDKLVSFEKKINEKKTFKKKFNFNKKKINDLKKILINENGLLNFNLSKKILEVFQINVVEKKVIKNFDEIKLVKLLENKKYFLKANSKKFIHKKSLGFVQNDITKENFEKISNFMLNKAKKIDKNSYLTLELEVFGIEVIIGAKFDENLGNFVMFGLGGTFVEIYKDIAFMKAPISYEDCEKLLNKTKVSKILEKNFENSKIDMKTLKELIIRVSYIKEIFPQIKEIDLNPVICNSSGFYLVDVKLFV